MHMPSTSKTFFYMCGERYKIMKNAPLRWKAHFLASKGYFLFGL